MATSIRMEYGSGSYGEGLYGGSSDSGRPTARVGSDFDIALNGVGLKLLPMKKAYDKHEAQTFSYNPKSLFKQGDGAALVAKDLYYWSRLEHSKWDGGETYEHWAPDPNDPSRLNHKYATSSGFDVTEPHRLYHLREPYVAPSFEFAIKVDSPLAYWLLADHTVNTEMFDQISSDRTPGLYVGNVIKDILPGPIVNDPNPIAAFDGSTAYAATGPKLKKVPFAGNVTPTAASNWSIEAWVNPASLPANEVIALIGTEAIASSTDYKTIIRNDAPISYWRLGEAHDATSAIDDRAAYNNLPVHDGPSDEVELGVAGAVPDADTALHMTNDGQIAFLGGGVDAYPVGAKSYNIEAGGADFSMEAWLRPDTVNQAGTVMLNWGKSDEANVLGATNTWGMFHGQYSLGFNSFINTDDFSLRWGTHRTLTSGYHFPAANVWYYCVITRVSGTWHFYVNGVEVGVPQVQACLQDEREGFSIGGHAIADAVNYNGRIDEVALYNYALTIDQIAAHYAVSAGVPGGGFGIAIGDGAGGAGSKLVARLPGAASQWIDSGYTLGAEGSSDNWISWWRRRLLGGAAPFDVGGFLGGGSTSGKQGAWYHIVLTYDGTNIEFYTNATLRATVAAAPVSAPSWAVVGATASTDTNGIVSNLSKYYKGLLAQVAVYNVELTDAQITAHYNAGIGAASTAAITSGQTYAKFVETYDGTLFINQKNTKIIYSADGGASWTPLTMPESDVTDFTALWGKGTKVYAATANNIYIGNSTSFVELNDTNPDITGATAGIFYSGQIYIGKGTSLYYVDPATGLITQLYDTVDFTINFIEAFQGKIWFGGTNGRMTRLWTWTNNTLPPSAANGVGAQIQDGTLPYGFVARCSLVYLNVLLIAGTIAGDTTSEGQGAVYYITSAGQLGQLCVLGPLMKDIRGTGFDYGVRSMWGAQNMLYMGYSYNTGVARYDFGPGGFSTHITKYASSGTAGYKVLAVAFYNGKALFAGADGFIWRESDNKVTFATLEESEFNELPFLTKMIDGIEGRHSPLLDGQIVQVELSFDNGATWLLAGTNSTLGSDNFDFPLIAVGDSHWRSRVVSTRGSDMTQAPEINNWSVRFAPSNNGKHEWVLEAYLPPIQKTSMGMTVSDVGNKLLAQLWSSRESGVVVDFMDRDSKMYKVLVIAIHEGEITSRPARASGGQLQLGATVQVELLEVQKVG